MGIGLGIGRGHAPKSEPTLWLLQDEFATDLAAGSVNGTAAEPGPRTRVVFDVEGIMTVSAGMVCFDNQLTPSWGDAYLRYASITRTPGRMLLGTMWSTDGGNALFGLSTSTTPSGAGPGNFEAGEGFWANAFFSYGTDWHKCYALRAAGYFAFVKSATFPVWTLQLVSADGTTANLYPAVSQYNTISKGNFVKVGGMRVPAALWLPTPLASDGFGSAFGTTDGLGHAEGVAGGIGAGGSGVTWSNVGSTWSVSGGKAINTTPSGLSQQVSVAQMSTADVFASAALTRAAGEVGLALSMDSASNPANGVLVYLDGTNCKIDKIVGGSVSNVRTTAVTYSAGARLVVTKTGTEYRVYYNNALVGAADTISDAGIVNNTLHGLFSTNASNTLDDFVCYATGTGGEYAELDKWS